VGRKPDLALDIEVETSQGLYRLPSDAKLASDRPQKMGFQTQRGDGFATGNAIFNRKIFKDYPDIGLLDSWRFVSRSADVAYEGRLHSNPRGNDPAQTINCSLVGFATMLKNRPVSPLIIDRRLAGWGEPTMERRAKALGEGYRYEGDVSTGSQDVGTLKPGVAISFSRFDASYIELGEAWFYGGGEDIGELKIGEVKRLVGVADANFNSSGGVCVDDLGNSMNSTADQNYGDSTNVSVSASAAGKKYARLVLIYAGGFAGDGNNVLAFISPRVIGKHGLPIKGTAPNDGFYLSDIIEYVFQNYFPRIKNLKINENPFVVEQATWHDDPRDGYEVLQQLNGLALWETNVWEGPTFEFKPADLTKYDWIIRTDDPGVQVMYEGDTIENFANGVVVDYTDFNGVQRRLWPADYAELRDERESNPANRHGEDVFISETVPWPCFPAEALQWGRAKLGEFNRPRRPATYRISGGYIKDAEGNWHQGWKVRNSQTIGVMDHPYDVPRLIYATNWDQESHNLEVTVDAPPQRLTAIVARHELAVAGM
jgi:hypothetical protein